MKHAVIVGHPRPDSFNLSVARAYCAAVERQGHRSILRDLYRMGFDPRLGPDELPGGGGPAPGPDVQAERAALADVDIFVFVYPLWFNAPPAMIKGYMDRVFGYGFGYGPIRSGGNTALLEGRGMVSLTSSGAPGEWLQGQADWTAIRALFDTHFASVCGLEVMEHIHFGGVVPGMTQEAGEAELKRVDDFVRRRFPAG